MNSLLEEQNFPRDQDGGSLYLGGNGMSPTPNPTPQKFNEDALRLHHLAPSDELRMSATSPTGGQMHSPSSNASSNTSDASKMTDKQLKRIQRLSALFPVADGGQETEEYIQRAQSLNLDRIEQQLALREKELIKRETALQLQQSENRRHIQDLRWQLERREGELASQKQRVSCLLQNKVDLQTSLETIRQQMQKQQQDYETAIQNLRRSPTRSPTKSPTLSQASLLGSGSDDNQQWAGVIKQNQELESEVRRLRSEVEGLTALKTQMVQREQQVMELRRALNIKEEELRQFRTGGAESVNLQCRIGELENALQLQTEESGSLRQQLAALRRSREDLGGKLERLETELQLEKAKSAQIKAQLREYNETNSQGECDSGTGTGGGDGYSGAIEELEKELERLRDRLAQADQQVDDLTNELRHKDHEMADVHSQLVTLRKNVLTMNNQVVAYASENKELQEKLRAKTAAAEIAFSQAQRATHGTERLRQENIELNNLKSSFQEKAAAMNLGCLAYFAVIASKASTLEEQLQLCRISKRHMEQKVTEVACDMFEIQRSLGLRPTSLAVRGVPLFPEVTYSGKSDKQIQEKLQQLQEIASEISKCQIALYDGNKVQKLSEDEMGVRSVQERALDAMSAHTRMGARKRLVKLLRGRNPWVVWLRRVIVTSAVLILQKRHKLLTN